MVAIHSLLIGIGTTTIIRAMKKLSSVVTPLIAVDRQTPKALHKQIYDAYRIAIFEGHLRPGERIPSTRALALDLKVSRFPVLNAYSQLLAEGYLESRVGAGTVICATLPDRFAARRPVKAMRQASGTAPVPVARRAAMLRGVESFPWLQGLGAFGVGQVAFDAFPLKLWSNLVSRHCRNMKASSFHYGDKMGSEALRHAVASYLRTSRSVNCEAPQVLIVGGSQQALEISARVLLDPGSSVWVEDPGYRLARDAFALTDCNLVPVPVDNEGLSVVDGIKRCSNAKAAIVTPSHQFPLGVTMSAQRRMELLNWAHKAGSWIIEDDYDSEYRYEGSPISSLQGLDANDRVIYIGTFSKVLFPSLRLGYIVVPSQLLDRFLIVRRAMDICSPSFYQDVLADFIEEGHFARHVRRMRTLYRQRRSALVDSLHKEFGSRIEVLGSEAGMHLTVAFSEKVNDLDVARRAARHGLWIWPLSVSYVGEPARSGFVLGFGSTADVDIPKSVRKLKRLLSPR